MNVLDLVILGLAVAAVIGGYRLGFLTRVLSWLGLAAGLLLAAKSLPTVVNHLQTMAPIGRLSVATLVLAGGALIGHTAGMLIGGRLHTSIPIGPIRVADRFVGAAVGVLGILVPVWLLLPSIAGVAGWPARQERNSSIARAIHRAFPPVPATLRALGRLVGNTTFPQVFNQLGPSLDTGPPPASSGLSSAVQELASASTVRVQGEACRRIQEGSGFAVSSDTIVTNAHVVAGERSTSVLTVTGQRLSASVVAFDPDRDLAMLHVAGLGRAPLPISPYSGSRSIGVTGAVLGHPNGIPELRATPALVHQFVQALGRDLYDSHNTTRGVYILASNLHPGDSGGALIDQSGTVIGIAFAIAPDRPGTSYALTAAEMRPILSLTGSGRVSTGPCLNGA